MSTIYLLTSGPSLTQDIADKVRGPTTMAIKEAVRLAPWADYLFFVDWSWFRNNRPTVDPFPGRVLTLFHRAKRVSDKVELITNGTAGKVISSGHGAVDVAMALGFDRIVLCGFDCRLVDGRSHCHGDYGRHAKLYSDRARKRGVTILNATPDSAIEVFPKVELGEVL